MNCTAYYCRSEQSDLDFNSSVSSKRMYHSTTRSVLPYLRGEYVCVFTSFPNRETLSAAKTVAVLANSFATRGALRAFGGHLF